ncbi:Predicted oxidoreductase [Pseudonocardia thermophila]|jgi:Predicted oxidoreductases (related to aryl-alcohol dehydrogenases)|uniref:Predicted oxidoreductase n=1 Tax=Pseudonocardia thermophila TaxID=1848 RepID=A0A1M6X3P6_PSETH|nr:aldo/keto reductase [Pseudonocardia thermophila]SHL00489.1 Predicted oxidoreductase [Pseudonocardia thermophila]
MTTISGIDVTGLCLGGNVFGWTVDREGAFAVLDAYLEAGGTMIDTADAYLWRKPGNSGGESEAIIGEWLASRGVRDQVVIATKVGSWPTRPGLSAANITAAAEDSLRRLQTDRIDLYYAHKDDPDTVQEETLDAFDALVKAGKVVQIGASNFTPERLRSALEISERDGLTAYTAVQPHYNLMDRNAFEAGLQPIVTANEMACFPYYGLAMGFLTGKYRGQPVESVRAQGAQAYLDDPRGPAVLAVLDEIAAGHGVPVAAVALAWLAAQPGVTAPIASARTVEQLKELMAMRTLQLTSDELRLLTHVSD